MIYEIRNYYYDPEKLDDYRSWAVDHALPFLRENLDVVGFWMAGSEPTVINGKPMDELGSAAVTWIIRWNDMAQREETMARVFGTAAWTDIFAEGPGREPYFRQEFKFFEAL